MPAINEDYDMVNDSLPLSLEKEEWLMVSDSQAEHAATIREYYLARATYYWNKK
jgi:hypothetical protein